MARYLQAEELEDYLTDFFEREFRGCAVNHNTPAEGCLQIRLTYEAQSSLSGFIRDDRSLSAQPFRQKEFNISFRREVLQRLPDSQRRILHFVNHISPLIRWITKTNQDRAHGFFDVSAIRIAHPELPHGDYCYRIERWRLKGLSNRETLAYGIRSLSNGKNYSPDESEAILQCLLRRSGDWDYVDCDRQALLHAHKVLEEDLGKRFSEKVTDFEAENETVLQIKKQRVQGFFDRRIGQDEQRLRTLREAGRAPRVIRLTEGRLKTAIENKEKRLNELKMKAKIDMEQMEQAEVGAGIFRVTGP